MRILAPLDGSVFAEAAVTASVRLLQQTDESRELMLVQAITDLQSQSYLVYTFPATGDTPPQETELLDKIATARYAYLTHVAQRSTLCDGGITVTPVVKQGEPAEIICAQAVQQQVDFIVLTSHGRTGFARLALGSVAEAVARSAPVPTLILPCDSLVTTDPSESRPPWLVPVDGTRFSEAALPLVVALARRLQARLRLYYVLNAQRDWPEEQQAAEIYVSMLCRQWGTGDIDITRQVGCGDPAEQLLAEIGDHPCDLIAMATHGRTGVPRLFLGSVTETLLHQGKIPVLIMCPHLLAKHAASSSLN